MKLGLIYGGVSVEHEISIITGLQIYEVIKSKYDVFNIYFAKNGKFYVGNELNDIDNYKDLERLISKCVEVKFERRGQEVYAVESKMFGKKHQIDLAFLALHGATGEDGKIQGFFDVLGLTYTGPSHYGCSIGQDKVTSKDILRANNLDVLDYCVVYDSMSESELKTAVATLSYPIIVKPSTLGSSVGISFCDTEDELFDALNESFAYEHKLIVEQKISNFIEVNCSILGNYKSARASLVERIVNDTDFLSFDDKYQGGGKSKGMASAGRVIPADISDELTKKCQEICLQAFKRLNLSGVVRFDLMIYNDVVYINEVNTIPGSLAFYLWTPLNMSQLDLYDELIKLAVDKKRMLESKTAFYTTNILKKGSFGGKKSAKKM